MFPEKGKQLERMKAGRVIEAAPRLEMRERDPGVLGIPNERRNGAERADEKEQIKTRPHKFAAQLPGEKEDQQNREQLECVGEFAEKAKADEQPGERPPPGKPGAPLEGEPEGVKRRYPEENRERIDRQDEAAEIENGGDIKRDHSPEAGERAKQAGRKIIQQQARAGGEKRAPEAHPEFVVAKERRARPDDEGHAGTFAEIRERRPLPPHPVISLVGRELGGVQKREPNRREHEQKNPHRARRAHEMESPTRRGCLTKNCGAQRAAARRYTVSRSARRSAVSPAARKKVASTSLGQCAPR